MTWFLDEAVGETRLVGTVEAPSVEESLVELRIERWSEAGTLARAGDTFLARIDRIEPGLGGFAELGLGPAGFLPFRGGRTPKGLHEGAFVRVEIAAEAAPRKGPRLRRLPDAQEETGGPPRRLACAPRLVELAPDAVRGEEARRLADLAQELALGRDVQITGGGSLSIEPTRALVAIDVDAGARPGRDRSRTVRALNIAAVETVARHIGLRGLSGMLAVDLVSMPARADRDAARAGFEEACAKLGVKADAAPVSRFGVLEAAVPRNRRALHEFLLDAAGAPTAETVALGALRRLEGEAAADRGARLTLRLPVAAATWLEDDRIGWRAALTDRIGARFSVAAHADPARTDVEVSET